MGLLDRFSNPVWYKASKLDKNRQRIVATVIGSYDAFRQLVEQELVRPLESFLKESGNVTRASNNELTASLRTQLIDEASLGLLRCCSCPSDDPDGGLPSVIVQGLPEIWATFLLADMNHRLRRSSPSVLEQVHYSKDPDEARTQVLIKWIEILGVTTPSFVNRLNLGGFASTWHRIAVSFIAGMLKGSSRVPEEVLISKARRVAAGIPPHRESITVYMIERLAEA